MCDCTAAYYSDSDWSDGRKPLLIPFTFLLDGPELEHSELAAKIQRLHIFFSLLIPDMNHEDRQLLDEALIQTYAKKGITHDNFSLLDPHNPEQYREMPILEDLSLKQISDAPPQKGHKKTDRGLGGQKTRMAGYPNEGNGEGFVTIKPM